MRHVLLVSLASILLWPAVSFAATATINDGAGDVPLSFEPATDLSALRVVWDSTSLSVTVAYHGKPRSPRLQMLVSQASKREDKPNVEVCDDYVADSFTVRATAEEAVLTISYVEGSLTAVPQWVSDSTVTYVFTDSALRAAFEPPRDPFVCASGGADGDRFFGAFDGKAVKLTTAVARRGLSDELTRRYGVRWTNGDRKYTACDQVYEAYDPGAGYEFVPANTLCGFSFHGQHRYRMGYARMALSHGVPVAIYYGSRSYPNALRYCGITGFNGGWTRRPFVSGAFLEVWGRGVTCRTARRVATSQNHRGFRCRTTAQGHEFSAVKCTRSGGRVVQWETGA